VLTINAEPPPQIDAVLKPDGVNLSFLALANHHYTVQCLSNLLNTNWTELVSGIVGDGTTQTVTDATTYPPARYYRLRVLTP
jgi:hypothetical protein